MKYTARPLFMTTEFFRQSCGYGPVGGVSDYDPRQEVVVEANSAFAAAEKVWQTFQNIDEGHMTPDGGRSMMVGDIVRVCDEDKNLTTLRCAMMGFELANFADG